MPQISNYYPWIIGFSAFIGILWTWLNAGSVIKKVSIRDQEAVQSRALTAAVLALVGAFLGSRISYILLHLNAYQTFPNALTASWASGLDWIGALPGAFLLLSPLLYRNRKHLLETISILTPLWTSICFGSWFAVSIVPVYYSSPIAPAWWSVNLPNLFGVIQPRLPIGAMGVIWTLLADILSYRVSEDGRHPALRFFAVIIYQMIFCLVMSFIRLDSVPTIFGIPVDRLFSLIYLAASAITLAWIRQTLSAKRLPGQGLRNRPGQISR